MAGKTTLMAKGAKKPVREWRITLLRRKGQYLGRVKAPDEESAIARAIEESRCQRRSGVSRQMFRIPHARATTVSHNLIEFRRLKGFSWLKLRGKSANEKNAGDVAQTGCLRYF